MVHLTVFICVVSGRTVQFCWGTAGSWSLYSIGNGLYHCSCTGALNGVHLCSVCAVYAVLLWYSRQLVCSCTVTATGLDQISGTGTLNGVHLCGEWADSAVLLRYSRQFVGSFTVTATGWIKVQLLVLLTVFIFEVSVRAVPVFWNTAGSCLTDVQLLTFLLTYTMGWVLLKNLSVSASSQVISCTLWTPMFHHLIPKCPQSVPNQSQHYPVSNPPTSQRSILIFSSIYV